MAKKEMENKLAECVEAVPALFASIGDTFTHATDDRDDASDVFGYEGRTSEGWHRSNLTVSPQQLLPFFFMGHTLSNVQNTTISI